MRKNISHKSVNILLTHLSISGLHVQVQDIREGSYSNNNALNAVTDVTSIPADFVVTDIKTFTPNYSGDRTTIEWTVRNDGVAVWSGTRYWYDSYSITGEWSDAVYLRLDASGNISDRLIGRKTFKGSLAGNDVTDGSNTYSLELNTNDNILLPGVTPGNYRIIVRTDIYNSVLREYAKEI